MITLLKDASFSDAKRELSRMLNEGTESPNVRRLAETAIAGKQDQIGAVFDFVQSNFPYCPDPFETELFISPNRMAEDYFAGRQRMGDCDDLALISGAMLGSIGYQTRLALLATGGADIDHAVAEVWSEELGEWVSVDASSKLPLGWCIRNNRKVVVE